VNRPRSHRHLLLAGGTVLTMDSDRSVIEGDVLVTDGRIAAVGAITDPPPATRLLDAAGCWILPGLVGAARPELSLLAGCGDDTTRLMEHHDEESLYWSGVVVAAEALRSGVTCLAVSSGEVALLRGLDDAGVRRIAARDHDPVPVGGNSGDWSTPAAGQFPWERMRTMVREGETPAAALASLTSVSGGERGGSDPGSVEPGRMGDLVVLADSGPAPASGDPHKDCVARGGRDSVRWVIVDGEIVFAGGRFPRLHPGELESEPGRQRAAMFRRAGSPGRSD